VIKDLWVILPEIVLLCMTSITLLVSLYCPKNTNFVTYIFSQLSLIVTGICCWTMRTNGSAFNEQFVVDPLATTLKLIILTLMFLVLLYSRDYTRERDMAYGEFSLLALFSTLGMMFLVSAKSLLMIYLGLELLSLPLYALVALRRDSKLATEAGMKYFVMGALASGMLLYGMSLLYGATGSIQLAEISQFLQGAQATSLTVSLFALVFIIVGIGFKLGAAPFHMWIPDIYQGAPTNVTLLIASAPKLAAFGMAFRLLQDALPSLSFHWSHFFIAMAILSLALGNIIAIVQTNLKRLLGYSTIAQIGFLFLGILVAPQVGYGAALFYIVTYVLVVAVAFGVLLLLSRDCEAETFEDIKGLAQRRPWLAFMMLLAAFSLAGVPPMVGFYAKFVILTALVNAGLVWLAALAVMFSIIGAFYYIKIVRVMYFEAPQAPAVPSGKWDFRFVLSVNGLAILALGIFPAPLYLICQNAFTLSKFLP
jgi:NADH-quinone oxidoreductase subunit N